MKKVIGIFMTMVMVFVFVSMAVSENPKGYSGSEVYTMVEEWARAQHKDNYLDSKVIDGSYCTCGVIETSDFKELTGNDFTVDELVDVYYHSRDYGFDWDVTNASVKLVGFYEGYDVYELNINTNLPIGTYDGEDYYNGNVIFMVCEN